ncbi:peptidoglycan endopeptidase, partial [Enterococcus mundtii]
VTFTNNNEDFWSSLDTNYSKGKTEQGRVFYISASYDTADNQPIYSVYTDETCTEWRGYYKGNNFEDTLITTPNNKRVNVTKAGYTIWGDLNFWTKTSLSVIGNHYNVNRKFYNSVSNASYYELLKDNKIYGYINSEAVEEVSVTSHNKYVTFNTDGEDFWTSLDTNYSKGKTERGRVFYIGVSYDTPNNQPIYSVYTDETCTEWKGYYKGNNFEDTKITLLNNATVQITKSGYTIWGDLNFWSKSSISVIDDKYTVNRKFYNSINNSSYYELLKNGTIYGYINTEAADQIN